MASNSFGKLFRITTWGESHGPGIGVVVDGCPAGIAIDEEMINHALARRAPGSSKHVSPRKEPDTAEILSGVFEGTTTGAPVCILIRNRDADSSKYEPIKELMRPGHANYTYLEKYGIFDYRGGGRSSARETACRVAAGAIARELLKAHGIEVVASLIQVGDVAADYDTMMTAVDAAREAGDSVGGVVAFEMTGLPVGLGDPVYDKLEARLAYAMMSLPATKGFEIGEGFAAAKSTGSQHNDAFTSQNGTPTPATNHAGGTLGGISTGASVLGRVAFKPTSSIIQSQQTVDREGKEAKFVLPPGSRHDPCVAIRAVPVVEAMAMLVAADALLMNRSAQLCASQPIKQ